MCVLACTLEDNRGNTGPRALSLRQAEVLAIYCRTSYFFFFATFGFFLSEKTLHDLR